MARRFGWLPDPLDARDLGHDVALFGLPTGDPQSSDLSAFEPPVWNQGSTNQCTGESLAAAMMIVEAVAGLPRVELSQRFPYYVARRASTPASSFVSDVGAYPREVVRSAQRMGICLASQCPRAWIKTNRRPTHEAYIGATARRGGYYFRINALGEARTLAVRRVLAARLPVMFGMLVPQSYLADDGPSVVDVPLRGDAAAGRHYQVLTGHEANTDYGFLYRVRNSWSASWKDRGHAWFTDRLLASGLCSDFVVVVGHELVRKRLDADPALAAWRAITANLEAARAA